MDTAGPIDNNSYFLMNPDLIWGTEMATSALDVEPVNATFRSVSSDMILVELQSTIMAWGAIGYYGQSQ